MLVLVVILIAAAVAVYAIWAVRPKRLRFRVGLGKITFVDFEADAGSPGEPGINAASDQQKRLPGGQHRRQA